MVLVGALAVILGLIGGAAWVVTRGDDTSSADASLDVDPADGGVEATDTSATDPADPVDVPDTTAGTATTNAIETTAGDATSTSTESTTTTEPTTTTTAGTGRSATISGISIDGGTYAVAYTTTFDPVISNDPSTHHLHFFFDTVGVENAGVPGAGPWKLYDGPSPFRGYGPADRPAGATKLCVTVATHEHTLDDPSTFHCADLPE
jgi:hypothetical protein